MSVCLGLFDSGVGGLTVLRSILQRHGPVPTVYLGDPARVPYGSRAPAEIRSIAAEVVAWLKHQQVSTVVMACNTTNALARDVAEGQAGVPVVGLIGAAAAMVRETRVGVLATPATVASGAYRQSIEALNPGTLVVQQACPNFVPLIESGDLSSQKLREEAMGYLTPLLEASVEAVILGCTHYPLLEPLLRSLLPPDVRLIDPAEGVARQLDALLGSQIPGRPERPLSLENTRLCVTADPESFARRATPWLGARPIVEGISLRTEG